MYLGTVIGTVVSTTKNEGLVGTKLLLVKQLTEKLEPVGNPQIVVDSVGAGVGETVIVATGSSARKIFSKDSPIDCAIVGIVDSVEVNY
ncbi:MAG: EutN/CcmL family microcompartment protein [Romboutsia sp.]|uniref:EutN/CcmL family microcompartment protein n=1 Tax=Romboutsia sp. TaxID=1965302 RepID=UPI003F40C3D6